MATPKGKWVQTIEIPVRWVDMDAFGHVNNSKFFTYFEQARITWWSSIFPAEMSFTETGPVIINANCTFFKAIIFPETLLVKLFVGPPGRSSHECFYEIYSKTHETIYAIGSTKVVWVDRQLGKSVSLPDILKNHLPTE